MKGLHEVARKVNLPASVDTDELLGRIGSGNAMLFIGSGFSYKASSVGGGQLPTAWGLAQELGQMGGFDPDNDLRYAADRFAKERGAEALVDYLRKKFSVAEPAEYHVKLAGVDWRRVYTTNYDLLFERAAAKAGRVVHTVEISQSPGEHWQRGASCVHINGSIQSISDQSIDAGFKLTNSSYLASDALSSSEWSFPFKRDLESAAAIVFVGYSLYDMEIQRILFNNADLKAKTYFVCLPDEPEKQLYTFSQSGFVLPIGVEGFATLIASSLGKFKKVQDTESPVLMRKYEPAKEPAQARDQDVGTMLLYGAIPDELVDGSFSSGSGAPLIVMRDALAAAERMVEAGNNLVVASDFGNGKTVFVRSLMALLAAKGRDVYSLSDDDPSQHSDLELLAKRSRPTYLFIDGFDLYLELVQHYGAIAPSHLRLVLSARSTVVDRTRQDLTSWGLKFNEISLDQLSDPEIERFVAVFDNAGLWGGQASLSHVKKRELIARKNRRQISLALLNILESPQMLERVSTLLSPLMEDSGFKSTIFAIALLEVLDVPLRASLISEISGSDAIYSPGLRGNDNFRSMFRVDGNIVRAKSALFALSIIRNHFSSPYVVDAFLRVVGMLGVERNQPREKEVIKKSLLRFSIVERCLPGPANKANLVRYYEELKRRATWLTSDPHYWLQYAMTQINFGEYGVAQKYLDQAYALANSRNNYHTEQFDTQQARMWLQMSADQEDPAQAYKLFSMANELLRKVTTGQHKFWQYSRYADIYARQYSRLSKGNAAAFEQALKNAVAEIRKAIAAGSLPTLDLMPATHIAERLSEIIAEIAGARNN